MVFECLARFKVAFTTLSTAILTKEKCFAEVAGSDGNQKMFFEKRDVYPSNVLFITATAFKSVELLRNNYFKISSNAPSNLLCNVWNFIFLFHFGSFSMLVEWYVYVIAWARGQLRINFTSIFKVFTKLPESRSDEGNLENFENTSEINP